MADLQLFYKRRLFAYTFVLLLLIASGISWLVLASGNASRNSPLAHLDIPGEIDFGAIPPSKQTRILEIYNPTRKPITITRVDTACGCTVHNVAVPYTVAPGETLTRMIQFDGTGVSGHARKTIVFHTDGRLHTENGAKNVAIVTHILAFVERPRTPSAVPATVNFGQIGNWESRSATVKIYNRGTLPLKIYDLAPASSDIELESELMEMEGAIIRITLKPNRLNGRFVILQKIETSQGDVQFEIRGENKSGLYVDNDVLVFQGTGQRPLEKTITVHHPRHVNPNTVQIKCAQWNVKILDVTPISRSESRLRFALTDDVDRSGVERHRGKLTLACPDLEECSEIEAIWVVGNGHNN